MIARGRLGAARPFTVVAVAAVLAGCGGAADTAACTAITNEMNTFNANAMKKISDPEGLKTEYDAAAGRVREAAKGSGVADEAEKIAAAMEKLGQQVADFAKNPGTTMPDLDSSAMIQAGVDLKNACS